MLNPYNCSLSGHAFVGFETLRADVLDGLTNGHSYAVVGGRRCGKTSMLKQLQTEIGVRGLGHFAPRAHFVNIQALEDRSPGRLFQLLYQRIIEGTGAAPWTTMEAGREYEQFLAMMNAARKHLAETLGEHWLAVLLVDELDAAIHDVKMDSFFGNLRDMLMESHLTRNIRLIATGVAQMEGLIKTGSPLNNLLIKRLGVLEETSARELIRHGFTDGLPAHGAAELEHLTGRHPYLMQGVLEKLWPERDLALDERRVKAAAMRFQREHSDFASWLKAFGPAEHAVYRLLCNAPDGAMGIEQLRRGLDDAVVVDCEDAITKLSYHGVIDDQDPDTPRIAGTMFRDWYRRHSLMPTGEGKRGAGTPRLRPVIEAKQLRGRVDFGIITMRPDEFSAVSKRFPTAAFGKGERTYDISYLDTLAGQRYTIALGRTLEQGQSEAQALASDMITDFDPQWLLLVGIAGGVPDDEFTLGDVVLATRVTDFSVTAAIQGRRSESDARGEPVHREVGDLLANIPSWQDSELAGWNSMDAIGRDRPPVRPPAKIEASKLYGKPSWRERVRDSLQSHFGSKAPKRQPIFWPAPVITSNSLIKNASVLAAWRQSARAACAVEMEAGGVFRAARTRKKHYPVLAIRGLSDIVGFKRHKDWTAYACHSAAAFAHALLRTGRVVDPRP